MALIPIGMTYTSTVTGCARKVVRCEKCGVEYVYALTVTESAQETSPLFLDNAGARTRSGEKAQAALEESLQKGCEPVPCPECGTIQEHMFARARELRFRWMRTWGLGVLVAGLFLGLLSIKVGWDGEKFAVTAATIALWVLAGAALMGGLVLLEGRQQQHIRYDPNSTPVEARKMLGRMLAATREEFLRHTDGPPADGPRTGEPPAGPMI